jgi:hypothetical protein
MMDINKFIDTARDLVHLKKWDALTVLLAHYGPRLIDMGKEIDRLHAENESLTAIVNMVEIAKERDELRKLIARLQGAHDNSKSD